MRRAFRYVRDVGLPLPYWLCVCLLLVVAVVLAVLFYTEGDAADGTIAVIGGGCTLAGAASFVRLAAAARRRR